MIPVGNTGGIQVRATSLNLLSVLDTGVARGDWLNEGTAREPVAVLGSVAAAQLGIDRVYPDQRIWLGGQWFNVAGILQPSPLEPDIDGSALIGYPAAQKYLGYVSIVRGEAEAGPPSSIYVRAATGHEAAVQSLLAQTADPEAPYEAAVSQPSDVLTARAAAAGAFDSLFLGLGVVALIVGAVGVANIMIISVLERRSEIGLRRALGATKGQIRTQFLAESILLAVIGGVVGVLAGAAATAVYASSKGWAVRDPRRGVGGRHRRGHPDRRVRRPDAGHSSGSALAYRGAVERVTDGCVSRRRIARRGRAGREALDLLARALAGGVLLYAGLEKALNVSAMLVAVQSYRLAPAFLERPLAYGLPWLEIALGGLLVLGLSTRFAALGLALLATLFMAAIAQALGAACTSPAPLRLGRGRAQPARSATRLAAARGGGLPGGAQGWSAAPRSTAGRARPAAQRRRRQLGPGERWARP